ncbi:probable cysteine--tRNA ligase, mitochondrial [Bombus terrestris]|uniref:cysteine--tRNA ligase n=1 Tax=Bombus terrestris TaxID=30195 RepID=A0A9B0C038_BOMTE|nr:probable cysteine--tRNA ligase, mitochondrial [Bombus terrestris]
MNVFIRNVFYYKIRKACYQFIHTETKLKKQAQWLRPTGYKTDIQIYNPITKCEVPLILKNKAVLTWYLCGPTVYDSAHIGHAVTYVYSDIIRRILSDHFNINVVTAMCITDIDDKIIARSKELKQNYKDLTEHYENEFIEDMKMLNVTKPHLYCRVTDYIPQIIQFVKSILDKGNAYTLKDGSVYFDTHKYGMYGKLSTPMSDSFHPDKKSPLDFCLWKAAKEGEPFWESPWAPGRPGWHIECSTIASTIFGSSVDFHSGGIDLIFPHHENEEAQSCCYHEVEQWVNYWVHYGYLSLKHKKMSKSLKNTIGIREFLEKYTANQFRILCLLSNYKNELQFSHDVMDNAVAVLHKIEHFISNCHNYIVGNWNTGDVNEATLFRCLEETKNSINTALANDFNTAKAMKSLINLINVVNKMLHDPQSSTNTSSTCITAVAAVLNYTSEILSKFGISNPSAVNDYRMDSIVECLIKFRGAVRNKILEQDVKDETLLTACDKVRSDLSTYGIIIKDCKTQTNWSIKKY